MNETIKIALVDDEQLILDGLSLLLHDKENIRVILSSNHGIEFLKKLASCSEEERPQVVLLDINMKPMDGFEVVEHLKKDFPNVQIIILSSHYQTAIFGHMIKLGVAAFIPKNASQELLIEAIQKVYQTGMFFSPKDHEMLASFVKNKSNKRHFNFYHKLTERELDVLKLICAEHTNQEIAEQLFISKRTVEGHRQNIMDKIGAKNTVGLIIYAIMHEIYLPDSKYFF